MSDLSDYLNSPECSDEERFFQLWGGCDVDADADVRCAYCDHEVGAFREEGLDVVGVYWMDPEVLASIDLPRWQKEVLSRQDLHLCEPCGRCVQQLGDFFFHTKGGQRLKWGEEVQMRVRWSRVVLALLAARVLRVQHHREYERDTGLQAVGVEKDTRPAAPGTLAAEAWALTER
jgi:hypothetical protein